MEEIVLITDIDKIRKYKKISGIYKIKNLLNNKVYIGQSKNISDRISSHRKSIFKENTCLYRSIRKYGMENFSFEVLKICEENLDEIENFYINYYRSHVRKYGYNIQRYAKSNKGYKVSKKTKKILSETTKTMWKNGQWVSDILQKRKITQNTEEYKQSCAERLRKIRQSNKQSFDNRRKVCKLDPVTLKVIEIFDSLQDASKSINSTSNNLWKACNGQIGICKKYRWKYDGEEYVLKEDKRKNVTDGHKRKIIFSRKHNKNEGRKVINCVTGEIFSSIVSAAESIGIDKNTLWRYLKGVRKNKTNFRYYIEND